MRKVILFFTSIGFLLTATNLFSQVMIENSSSLKLGPLNNVVNVNHAGRFFQAQGVIMGSPTSKGTMIEYGNNESSGIYMDGDKLIIWSPGDENLVNFCDEDQFMSPGTEYYEAILAYIDGSGYYYQISDSTTKEAIQNISLSLSKIMKLRGVEYYHKKNDDLDTLKTEGNQNNGFRGNTHQLKEKKSGFLAQEVESIIPEAVTTNKAGKKYMNYQAIIPYLVEAIKEQQLQLNKQSQEIELMHNQIDLLLKSIK